MKTIFKKWFPFVVVISAFCMLTYASVQQAYRQEANDPQIQMAEDVAHRLETETPNAVLPADPVEVSTSLAPYWIVFDPKDQAVAANARLHGQIPAFVPGALEYARQHGENRITWQPEAGVRSAVVIVPVANGEKGFVLAGRSLREVEKRVNDLTALLGIGLGVSLAASFFITLIVEFLKPRSSS